MEYLEFYETTGFIIIVSVLAVVIALAIGIVIFCCCCKNRRTKLCTFKPGCLCCVFCKPKAPKKYETFNHKNLDNSNPPCPMNDYTDCKLIFINLIINSINTDNILDFLIFLLLMVCFGFKFLGWFYGMVQIICFNIWCMYFHHVFLKGLS